MFIFWSRHNVVVLWRVVACHRRCLFFVIQTGAIRPQRYKENAGYKGGFAAAGFAPRMPARGERCRHGMCTRPRP